MSSDKEIIEQYGGATKVARLIGSGCTPQRVQNWMTRGIPARIRLDHPHLFPVPKPAKRRRSDRATPP